MKYWVITYIWKRNSDPSNIAWKHVMVAINEHPIDYIYYMRTNSKDEQDYQTFHLVNQIEISKEQYEKYEEEFS